MRVQIPAYTDMWMRGDCYADVVKVTDSKTPEKHGAKPGEPVEIAHVKLDRSGKTRRFILADCTPV
jgi:hypothetical protein